MAEPVAPTQETQAQHDADVFVPAVKVPLARFDPQEVNRAEPAAGPVVGVLHQAGRVRDRDCR